MRKKVIGKSMEYSEYDCELTDQEIEEIRMIDNFSQAIIDVDGCEEYTFNILMELYMIGKNVGWADHKDLIIEFLSDIE